MSYWAYRRLARGTTLCNVSMPLSRKRRTARGLADALLVFDHGDADIALAMLAERNAGRDHDAGFLHHQGRELHAADLAEGFRQRRPGEHRGGGRRNLPSRASERFHQRVAALA